MRKVPLYLFILTVSMLWITHCGPSIIPSKGGSEVWGKVVDASGADIADAEIVLYQIFTNDSLLSNGTFVTGSNGEYRFKDIQPGNYLIQGEHKSRNLVVLRTDISYDSGVASLGIDIMKAPGAVLCIFTGAEKDDLMGASGFIPKSSYHGFIDNDSLLISGIYPGIYTLKCALKPHGYLPVVVDTLRIESNMTRVMTITVQRDTSGAPPEPQNLSLVSYDTLHGIATVRWSAVHVNDLDGYRVYSGLKKDSLTKESKLIEDTVFSLPVTTSTTSDSVINYVQVKAIDNRMRSSSSNILVITAPSPSLVTTTFSDTLIKPNEQLYRDDTVIIAALFSNQTRAIDSVVWALGRPDSAVKVTRYTSTYIGNDSLHLIWGDQTELLVYLSIYDNSGNVLTSEKKLTGSEMYPPNTWKVFSGKLPNARQFLTAVAIDSVIYTLGGRGMWLDTNRDYHYELVFNTIECFTPVKQTAFTSVMMVSPRNMHASVVYDNKIYSIGGSPGIGTEDLFTIEMYDPETNRSNTVYTMPEARVGAAACVYKSKLIITGGLINNTVTGAIDVYDLVTNTWYNAGSLAAPRLNHATVVCGDKMYVLGGIGAGASGVLSSVEIIDPVTGSCTQDTPMQQARSKFSAVSVGSRIYVFGGYISKTNILTSVEMLDCGKTSHVWQPVSSMSSARYGTAAAGLNGKIYLIGGAVGSGRDPDYSALIEVYYP